MPTQSPSPSQKAPDDLRSCVQNRIISDVFQNSCAKFPGWMVLVVDEPALRTISSVLGMYDLMEHRITLTESLGKKRAPFREMGVIYLVSPTEESVDKIIEDWTTPAGATKKKPHLYGDNVFIYFLNKIPDSVIFKIKKCKSLLRRIKALAELNVDFLAKEKRVFHFDMKSSFANIFQSRQSLMPDVGQLLGSKLVTVCASMNEYPHIRYPANSQLCNDLAMTFHSLMNGFIGSNPTWWYYGGEGHKERDRSTLLILDRSSDVLSPFMHEFTYQAMVNDLLPIEDDKISYKPDVAENPDVEEKEVLLNENDQIWVELKTKHIADVIQTLSTRIRDIVNSDSGAKLAKDSGKSMSLSQMASALRSLPEYREVMSKLSQHMHISHQCMADFNKQNLLKLSELEQTLATGITEEGQTPRNSELMKDVESMLAETNSSNAARLIAITIISQNGLPPGDKERLFEVAQLSPDDKNLIQNLERLGVSLEQAEVSKISTMKSMFRPTARRATAHDNDSEYASSRYVCNLKLVLEELANDQLSMETYPSILPMPAGGGGGVASVRKKTGSARTGHSRFKKADKGTSFAGSRQIVFMIGGLCYSELRAVHETTKKCEKEIVVGSTNLINPEDFIENVMSLG